MASLVKISATSLLAVVALGLVGCSSNPLSKVGQIFGREENPEASDVKKKDDAPDRVAVLALEQELIPDPRFEGVTIELPPAYVNTNWSQPGGESDHTLHHVEAPLTLTPLWSANVSVKSSARTPLISPPVIADGVVYTIDPEAKITATNLQTGARVWRQVLTPDVSEKKAFWQIIGGNRKASEIGFGGGVAVDNGKLFAASGFGFVTALDAASGEVLWTFQSNAPVRAAPTAANGAVYVRNIINHFVAIDQETGKELWSFESFEEQAKFLTATSAAANEEIVVVPFSSGEVTALRAENGRQLWTKTVARSNQRTALSNLADVAGSPIIDRGVVYAVSHAGQMSAIDVRSGQSIWENGISSIQMPWIADDFLFVVTIENELVALAREDGAVAWIKQLPKYEKQKKKKKRISWSGPVAAGGKLLLVSTKGQLAVVSPADGSIERQVKIGKSSMIAPIIAEETVFVLNDKGNLVAFK